MAFILKYLHLYFHCFNIFYRTNEVHSSMNIVSLITAQRYGNPLWRQEFPLFLECCYFNIASTRCKAVLIASPNKFRISQCRRRLSLNTSGYLVYVQFNQNTYLTVQKGAHPSQNKQVLMVCVALWRHSTSTGSKHDAADLTDSQDIPQTLLKEIRCFICYKW